MTGAGPHDIGDDRTVEPDQPSQPDPHAALYEIVRSRWSRALGRIERARPYVRGGERTPKIRIDSERGAFIAKRRVSARIGDGRDPVARVAWSHMVMIELERAGVPVVPTLRSDAGLRFETCMGTDPAPDRIDGDESRDAAETVIEVFRFVESSRARLEHPGHRLSDVHAVGAMLGRVHATTDSIEVAGPSGAGRAEATTILRTMLADALNDAHARGVRVPRAARTHANRTGERLRATDAALAVLGFDRARRRPIHGDWHPGNVRFRDGVIVAILDFDTARRQARSIEVAEAILRFATAPRASDDPATWPIAFDAELLDALVRGWAATVLPRPNAEEPAWVAWALVRVAATEFVPGLAALMHSDPARATAVLRHLDARLRWIRRRLRPDGGPLGSAIARAVTAGLAEGDRA